MQSMTQSIPSFAIPTMLAMVLAAGIVVAQTGTPETPDTDAAPALTPETVPQSSAQTTPTLIPEIPAGADPMERAPDPAEGSAAATAPAGSGAAQPDDTDCVVRRADTDTGFIVVCR